MLVGFQKYHHRCITTWMVRWTTNAKCHFIKNILFRGLGFGNHCSNMRVSFLLSPPNSNQYVYLTNLPTLLSSRDPRCGPFLYIKLKPSTVVLYFLIQSATFRIPLSHFIKRVWKQRNSELSRSCWNKFGYNFPGFSPTLDTSLKRCSVALDCRRLKYWGYHLGRHCSGTSLFTKPSTVSSWNGFLKDISINKCF